MLEFHIQFARWLRADNLPPMGNALRKLQLARALLRRMLQGHDGASPARATRARSGTPMEPLTASPGAAWKAAARRQPPMRQPAGKCAFAQRRVERRRIA